MPLAPPSSSPPTHNDASLARRRSISRASGSLSSYRSSLGGKAIGPKYGSSASGALRRGAEGSSSSAEQGTNINSSSALSEGNSDFDGSDGGFAARFGSFSATREELRDGSARLASLSLSSPSPLPSPGIDTASSSNPLSSSAPHSPSYASIVGAGAPPPVASSSSPMDAPTPRADPSKTPQLAPSPSNLALARPHILASSSSSSSPDEPQGGQGSSPTSGLVVSDGSPSSGEDLTPTQSTMGSLDPNVALGSNSSAVVVGDVASSGSGGKTPVPKSMLSASRERAKEKRRKEKIIALGDEVGGSESDDEEEEGEGSGDSRSRSDEEEGEEGEEGRRGRGEANGAEEGREQSLARSQLEGVVAGERTPLLAGKSRTSSSSPHKSTSGGGKVDKLKKKVGVWFDKAQADAKKAVTKESVADVARSSVAALPAVILGVLMNILDGVSYGMIMFPTNLPIFADFGGIGVSMFFVSCVVSQVVYSGGGSIFRGGNGSMMIEVVPFFHVIVGIIAGSCSEDKSVVATTMVAFALSSILTGIAFGLLGFMKLGSLSEFFPRHILVGCIGGVGAFLLVTGFQVSARVEESASFSLELLKHYFALDIFPLWLLPLLLAITLRLITSRWHHPLIFPGFFLAIPLVFYGVALSAGFSVEDLRDKGWVFEVNGVDSEWYEYWTFFDWKKTDFSALIDTIPTQLALVFFGLLHVPINVPALGISVGEDNVNTNRELVAHGISNVAAGLLGTVPNYLCYVNSVLFYKVGGTTRLSGFLLALASFGVLVAGPGIISVLPVCVVGALIFILGIDLVKEAIWDTHGRVARFEFATILTIVFVMTVWDFVAGIGVGVILACVSFVISSSQRRAVRSVLTGAVARSTVRRHPKQNAFLKEVGKQTRVLRLQGFLFFGTISACEATIRKILEHAQWRSDPIRFLVLDFSMASGVDFSAAEAFVRIQRLLEDKQVVLVLCGCPIDSSVGLALRSVDLWADGAESKVEVFENLNDALEHCENAYLRSLYSKDFQRPHLVGTSSNAIASSHIDVPKSELDSDIGMFAQSPRASHLRNAAKETISRPDAPTAKTNFKQPMPLLLQSLRPFSPELNEDFCFRLVPYFKRVHIERGTTLWETGSSSDSFYLIESGMLRANYIFLDRQHSIVESMVAGTISGEMSFLSRTKRNATVTAERDSVLWRMDIAQHEELGKKEGWSFSRKFEQALLTIASEEQDVLMGHLISSL